MKEKGFSTIEMGICVMVILAISAISVSSIPAAIASYRLSSSSEAITTTLYRARSMAVTQNSDVNVLFSTTTNSFGIDLNNNGVLDGLEATPLPAGTTLTLPTGAANPAVIRFTSRGEMPITVASPILSNPPSVGLSGNGSTRQVNVSLRGSVSITSGS